MINIAALYMALKIISIIGLITTVAMMVAILYKKLKDYYPVEVENNKYIFIVAAILLAGLLVFIFDKFFVPK